MNRCHCRRPFGILALEIFCNNIIRNIKQAEQLKAQLQVATAPPEAAPALQASPDNPTASEHLRPGSSTDLSCMSNIVVSSLNRLSLPSGMSQVRLLVQPDTSQLLNNTSRLEVAEQQLEGQQQQQYAPCKHQEMEKEQLEESAPSGMTIHYSPQEEPDFF